MSNISGLSRDLPMGFYPRGDLPTYQPQPSNYTTSTGLLAANPYFMKRERQGDFNNWWEGFKSRVGTVDGITESAKLVVGLNLGMRFAMRGILAGLTRAGANSSQGLYLISNTLLCGTISGIMTLYQRHGNPASEHESFLKQWAVSFAYSLPSTLVGMRVLPKFGFRAIILQNVALEVPQAALAMGTGYFMEGIGARDEMRMEFGERFLMELTEGLFFMGAGHAVGSGINLCTQIPIPMRGRTTRNDIPEIVAGDREKASRWNPFEGVSLFKPTGAERRIQTPGPRVNVFTGENLVASLEEGAGGGQYRLLMKEVELPDLLEGATELRGRRVNVVGKKKLKGVFKQDIFEADGKTLRDEFVQVQAYYYLSQAIQRLEDLGIKVMEIHGSIHNGRLHEIRMFINAFDEANAYFAPGKDHLAFGIHVGSDGDVVVHEFGHSLLHHADPRLISEFGGEAGAIHEGTGDALAVLIHNDPHLGEFFAYAFMGQPPKKDSGLRRVDHHKKLSDVGEEVHDRGEVYGGFWWSMKQRFMGTLGLSDGESNDLALRLLVNHAFSYATANPAPADFVDAVLRGARGVEKAGLLPRPMEQIEKELLAEATARELWPRPEPKIPPPSPRPGADSPWYSRWAYDTRAFLETAIRPPLFRRLSRAPFIGGEAEFFQQDHSSPYGRLEVVGHGTTTWHGDLNGKIQPLEVAHRDVRRIRDGEISHQVDLKFTEALGLAEQRLIREQQELDELVEEIARRKAASELTDEEAQQIEHIVTKRHHILNLALQHLRTNADQIPRDLVVFRQDNYLSYWINLEYATLLVPANRQALSQITEPQMGLGLYDCRF